MSTDYYKICKECLDANPNIENGHFHTSGEPVAHSYYGGTGTGKVVVFYQEMPDETLLLSYLGVASVAGLKNEIGKGK